MAGPKRQHFIPRSYLKNFSVSLDNDDKAFVEVMNLKSGQITFPFSIMNLCVSKNIYTIPGVDEKDKYFLENYYAQNVDGVYPEVYRILTNEKQIEITEEERKKILSTTLSLYFRTSKFLNEKNKDLEDVFEFIERAQEKLGGKEKDMELFFAGRIYNFKMADVEEAKEKMRIDNKTDFIVGHFENWQNFVRHKYDSQITVLKVTKEFPLITSDNPVNIYNHKYKTADIFDPNNSIQLPLDDEHFLWISPKTQQCERNVIYRGLRDKWFSFVSNSSSQESATEWIIGKEDSLAQHIQQQQTYTTSHPEGAKAIDSIQTRVLGLVEFMNIVEKNGIHSDIAIGKFKELQQNLFFKDDPMFIEMTQEMTEKGFLK
jgi:hypothetical protein